ncbi:3429_t:CDS:10 [Paraglomus occultum]|uniref:3429_t:CDS:1 n=1 Tax=Paraglomus occultum TaxID=144539 RepID=A0A9N8ZXE1_9GLOM|nr:3429_t:CDS:10 [Paraglomus occultum]
MSKKGQPYSQLSVSAPDATPITVINPLSEPQPHNLTRPKSKQPNRTTKTSQKLTFFPEEQEFAETDEYGETYSQIFQRTARREAEKFSKLETSKLPRVTAYCTASSYRLNDLMNYLKSRKIINGTAPLRFDECIYTPFTFYPPRTSPLIVGELNNNEDAAEITIITPEVLYFEYGVVVIWGMCEEDERRVLRELIPFEEEKLASEDVETEEFHYHYADSHQPSIYNDVITLKNPGNYMVRVTISHAIAQSVKMTLFEGLVEDTIEATKDIPQTMAETGKVQMSRVAITKKIGQLFIMRMNVNLVSNVLDTPEMFWSEPAFKELYKAIRGYLEISQRVEVLNQRVDVIGDLLDILKEHLTSSHDEQLEWIVIILIAVEIVIGVMTIWIDATHE